VEDRVDGRSVKRRCAIGQAAYFLVTGIWPLVDIRSFERITGPKLERWLVKTAGALLTVEGAVIGLAAWRRRLTSEVELLAVGSALGLAVIDVVYVARRRIRPVYLLDAAVQLSLIVGWVSERGAGSADAAGSGGHGLDDPRPPG
jgi:hypothetical protein